MRALVTGASGFVGVNLVAQLLREGHEVMALSQDGIPPMAARELGALGGELREVRADVRDANAIRGVFREHRFDAVFSGAAITAGAQRELREPAHIIDVNLGGSLKVLTAAAEAGVKRVVFASSTAAVGNAIYGEKAVGEEDPVRPTTIYGISKFTLESCLSRWVELSNSPEIVIARLAAVMGPWERDTGVRDTLSPFYQIAQAAVRGEPILPLPTGGQRDWVFAPFVADALHWMLTAPSPLEHRMYSIGAGRVWHPRLFLSALQESGFPIRESTGAREIAFNDDLSRSRVHLSVERLSRAFAPPPDPEAMASRYAGWVREHADWFRSSSSHDA